jgi:hypothetical protein
MTPESARVAGGWKAFRFSSRVQELSWRLLDLLLSNWVLDFESGCHIIEIYGGKRGITDDNLPLSQAASRLV